MERDILMDEHPDLLSIRKEMVRAFTLMSRSLERQHPHSGTDLAALIDDYVTAKVEYILALKGVEGPHAKALS